ncbi:MAG: hypothetical protein V3S81_00120 [Anaerolineales bacterium]
MEVTAILAIIAGVLLILHWKGPNAVWGGAGVGAIVGLVIALIKGDWGLLALSFAAGTFAGTVFEWVGRIANKLRSG